MRTAPASPDNIDTATLWGAIRESLPWLVLWTFGVVVTTFGVLTLIAPRYQSEAQLTIDAKTATSPFSDPKVSASSDSTASQMDREAINTHIKSLQSPTLAAKIVADLKLKDRPEFNSELGDVDLASKAMRMVGLGGVRPGQTEQDRVLEAYFGKLEVYSARESRFIGLRFLSVDPQLAADIPNALAEAYREQLAGRKVEETKDVQDALLPKIEQLTKEVASAEVTVEQFRGKTDSFNTGAQQKQTLNEQQLGELTNELSKAQAARSEAESRARSAQEMLRGGSGEVLPDVQKSPLIQNLVQQRVRAERQIAEVSATLLPGHPRMQQLNADLAGLKKQITAEVSKIVDGLSKEAKVSAERETSIKKRLSELKVTVVNAGPDEAKLKMLVADARSKRDELERLQAQYNVNKTRAESKAVPVEAKILSPAYPSSVPVYPRKGAYTALAALAAFMLGLALTVLKALASGARSGGTQRPTAPVSGSNTRSHDHSLSPPVALSQKPAASPLPAAASFDDERNVPVSEHAASHGAALASTDALVSYLLARTPERGGYRTLVVGETGGTDATQCASALARGLADGGQPAILVEWTFTDGLVARHIGLADAPGMAELVTGTATFEDVIASLPGSQCHFIPAGEQLADASPRLDPDQLNLVLDALDEAYAHIVVTGEHESVRSLFETIQGRFDAGVVVASPSVAALRDPDGTFLGFEVADIEILRLETEDEPIEAVKRRVRGLSFGSRVPSPA